MHHCKMAGNFEIAFEYLESDGSVRAREHIVIIGTHSRAYQRLSQGEPDGDVYYGETPPRLNDNEIGAGISYTYLGEAPKVSNKNPYKTSLCSHELAWLKSLPGKEFSAHYRFTVKALSVTSDGG